MLLESKPGPDAAFPDPAFRDGLLNTARFKLQPPERIERAWPAIAAAAFFAVAALVFAAASVLAPPVAVAPAAKAGVQ